MPGQISCSQTSQGSYRRAGLFWSGAQARQDSLSSTISCVTVLAAVTDHSISAPDHGLHGLKPGQLRDCSGNLCPWKHLQGSVKAGPPQPQPLCHTTTLLPGTLRAARRAAQPAGKTQKTSVTLLQREARKAEAGRHSGKPSHPAEPCAKSWAVALSSRADGNDHASGGRWLCCAGALTAEEAPDLGLPTPGAELC